MTFGVHVAHASGSWTVTTTADNVNDAQCSSSCTLREAINAADADSGTSESISFASNLNGTIVLNRTFGTLTLSNTHAPTTITGLGTASLAIDGAGSISPTTIGVTVFTVNSGVTVTISKLTVQHGVTLTNSGGGAVNSGVLTINNCIFSANATFTSFGVGGGINNSAGTLTISNSTFSGNEASSNGEGGGVSSSGGTVNISNSTFSANNGNNGGGGVYSIGGGTLKISNSTFSGNTANFGGGVAANGTVTISNSTFSGNTVSGSGGAVWDGGSMTISNSTFSGNSAGSSGGGVLNNGTLNLGSSIVAGNINNGSSAPDVLGTVQSLGYNIIGNISGASGFVSTDQQNVNPQLSGFGNYGGATQTYSLRTNSSAIGKGNCSGSSSVSPVAPAVSADQRGVARKVFGIGCDVGAFEDFGFSPQSLPNAIQGSSYSQAITPSGGTAPYTFSTVAGLPSGISLTSSGTLQGTTNQIGGFSFMFTVTDNVGDIVYWGYTLTVLAPTATPTPTTTPTPTVTPIPSQPDTIGVYRSSSHLFLLRNSNTTGIADIAFAYNYGSKPYPVVGNWTVGGSDTAGLMDESNGQFFLRNSNTAGTPDEQFVLGIPNDEPIAGQWTVSGGHDGMGVFRPTNGLLLFRNALSTGFADYVMVLGIPGDQGLAGDWKPQGYDTAGVYRPSNQLFLLSNQMCNCSVFADYVAQLGNPGDNPVTGDWIAQGHAGIGVFRPTSGLILLKNQIATGFADIVIVYGIPNDVPVAGHWTANVPPAPYVRPPSVLVGPTTTPIRTPSPGEGNLGG